MTDETTAWDGPGDSAPVMTSSLEQIDLSQSETVEYEEQSVELRQEVREEGVEVTETYAAPLPEPAHADRGHLRLGGSKAEIWFNCSGSEFLRDKCPPRANTKFTEQGTKEHELCEIAVADFLQHKLTGSDPDIRAHLISCEEEETRSRVFQYRDFIWEEVLHQSITGKAYGIEDRFVYSEKYAVGGPVDFWVYGLDDKGQYYAHLVDYKSGYVKVEARKNAQLLTYSASFLQELKAVGKYVDYFLLSIFQPKNAKEDGTCFDTWKVSAAKVEAFARKIDVQCQQIYVIGKPKFKVGKHCKYCPATPICKAFLKTQSVETSLALAEPDNLEFPSIETVPDETIVKLLMAMPDIARYAKTAKAYVIQRMKEGHIFPGMKIVSGVSKRFFPKDNQDFIAESLSAQGITDIWNWKLKGIGEVESQLKALYGKEAAAAVMAQLTAKTVPSMSLVPESDKRPAAVVSYDSMLLEDDGVDDL